MKSLHEVAPGDVVRRVPPFVYAQQRNFSICERCNRIYWGATHPERAMRELECAGLLILLAPICRQSVQQGNL